MKTFAVGLLVIALAFMSLVGIVLLSGISSLNQEASLKASVQAHLASREASFDMMKKIITQKSQLPAAAKADLLALLPEVVAGRSGGNVFKSVQESYPQLTLSLYKDISESIEIERHTFQREQRELLDVQREYMSLYNSVFGGTVCKMFGRKPVEVNVVSSTEAKEVVRTGVDDDSNLNLGK